MPGALGAGKLVVRAVADEEAFAGLDAESLARDLVDPAIGLRDADVAREHRRVERPAERCVVPDLRDVLRADADHPQQMAAAAQLVECRDGVGSRDE